MVDKNNNCKTYNKVFLSEERISTIISFIRRHQRHATLASMDLNVAQQTALKAATKAGERIYEGFEQDHTITVKGDPVDRVTEVDTDAQTIIVETIESAFPDHGFLGEEDLTRNGNNTVYRWVIDPIDGTSNFIQGLPHCGTSIALEENGEPILGVLHLPMLGTTYSAVKGEGAYCNGKKIRVRECSDMSKAVIAEIFSDRTHRGQMVEFPPCLAYRKFGSAISSLAYLAAGKIDGTDLLCYRCDIAAASIIVREAGAKLEWQYLHDDGNERGPLHCVAANQAIFADVTLLSEQAFRNR